METPITIIFAGRSGCGKGTQLKLIREYMAKKGQTEAFSSVTGDMFRAFFNENTYTSQHSKEVTARGELQPLFLTIYLWASGLVQSFDPSKHLYIDGYPRRIEESVVVDSMLSFYGRKNVVVINFVVSPETSKKRMLSRGRADDTPENVDTRLAWYDEQVTPAIEYFRNKEGYVFFDIDAERSIEEIHADIISKLNIA